MKNILEAPFMVETVRTLTNLYRLGWDERNGGNLSYLLYDEDIEGYLDTGKVIRNIPMSFDASEIKGKIFLVTGTGKYFKNVQYPSASAPLMAGIRLTPMAVTSDSGKLNSLTA